MSTPISTPPTNIRVFVQWTEQTVFAGEDIECQITFKNVAATPTPSRISLHPSTSNGFVRGAQRKAPATQVKTGSALSPRPAPPGRGHRSTLSLNVPAGSLRSQPTSSSWATTHPPKAANERGPHKRSISIISIGASEGGVDDAISHGSFVERPRGISRGHGRSASLQIVPRRHGVNGGPTSGKSAYSILTQP
jgi:RAB6A-GEF complex partner protein 2